MTSLFEEWIRNNLERNVVDGTVIFNWINNWINQDITWVVDTRQIMWTTRGADKSLARPGRKKLQRPNSGFIQHIPHKAQYTS